MARLTRQDRRQIAARRLVNILTQLTVASARTLEQKISDAGPNDQRIDPHILTEVRRELARRGRILETKKDNSPWFSLDDADPKKVQRRLDELAPLHQSLNRCGDRIGEALEIATYRALCTVDGLAFFGRFTDLNAHDDSRRYVKEEPPQHIGMRSLPGKQSLDFIVLDGAAGPLGIECKNVREWLYPDRVEIREWLSKCLALDAVPVLIARRVPFVSFKLLLACGCIIHQTYNQRLPLSEAELADKAKHKDMLGFHDIVLGNEPDGRLLKFVGVNLGNVALTARGKFTAHSDLLGVFASGKMPIREFSAGIREREEGADGGDGWEEEEREEPDWDEIL